MKKSLPVEESVEEIMPIEKMITVHRKGLILEKIRNIAA